MLLLFYMRKLKQSMVDKEIDPNAAEELKKIYNH